MLNFIAVALVSYFTQYHYKIPGDAIMQTAQISPSAHIARLGKFIPGNPKIVVESMGGAGGLIGTNWAYVVAPKDGSVILSIPRQAPILSTMFPKMT